MQNNNQSNVFFIFTPLHAVIAASIIERENLKDIIIVALPESSPKTISYCKRFFLNGRKYLQLISIEMLKAYIHS
ncbi:hypothetical protein PS673_00362 [Pseudomonas fluorescens]|uniref:Uncharacterized protein n=1 Tax=Pseudomonas fluorescens TaxID=294 RepID=A0A5E6PLG2_PSEFL|nr:hypothetical protein [Pseudomonas fluorescens]VVM43170.1 hypothetical protein PS673_00362 [Pseudomonas fluorescens]